MFKNLTLARVTGLTSAGVLGAAAQTAQFAPCGPTQVASVGFVPPRGPHGAWCESVVGHWILAVQLQTKAVPPAEIDKLVDKQAAAIERETGRKPGKKQRRELKEEALLELLPKAFPKDTKVLVWIDVDRGLLAMDNVSPAKTDAVATLLVQAMGLIVAPLQTEVSPAAWMRDQLVGDPGVDKFDLGSECELRNPETKATVRYSNLSLAAPDVREHVQGGKAVRKLGLEWTNGAVADFVLADDGTLRKIDLTTPLGDGQATDEFDANITLGAGTLRVLIADLIAALGGEIEQ